MALSLSAEQRNILKIFKIEEQYVIPVYQRPYSWEYDQCFQLYNDLMEAFQEQDEYFVGNIIIAKSEADKSTLEVIDGQQRLTTMLLIIKVLQIMCPNFIVLSQILEQEDWTGNSKIPRLRSDIFEANDNDFVSLIKYDKETIDKRYSECLKKDKIVSRKCKNKFEENLLNFYNWFKFYDSNYPNKLIEFVKFFLENVYLLPIELTGKTHDEANEKALVIFETINNRGLNLEDADIFKAKLYERAKRVNEEKICLAKWKDFKNSCDLLNMKTNEIFRYYSHIIRGKQGISTNEENLRHFFIRQKFSPFENKKYGEVFDDLFTIISIIEFIISEKNKESELAKWLQILDFYSNQYPKYALVNYIYINGQENTDDLILFLKKLIRYTFYQGPTSSIKFEMFNIIKDISSKKDIKDYYVDSIDEKHFEDLGRLKYGFALLAFYLNENTALKTFFIDKLLPTADILLEDLESNNEIIEYLGNFIVLDIPKRNLSLNGKLLYYMQSKIEGVKRISSMNSNGNKIQIPNKNTASEIITNRDIEMKKRLVNFFRGYND